MKSAVLAVSVVLLGTVVVSVAACADSSSDIPGSGEAAKKEEPGASLPAPTGGGGKDAGASANPSGTSSSSGSTSSGSTSSGSTSSGAGGAPACTWAGDFQKMIAKASEIQKQAPCDATCNPTTHCCLDITGGGGGGGIPGLEAGAGTGSGVCVSN